MKKAAMISFAMVLLFAIYTLHVQAEVTGEWAGELSVFSAAGAKPAMDEICQKFEAQTGIKVKINYAGAGEALSQMMLSKSGDVYVAPEQSFMESAKEKKVIDPQTIRILAYMIPVIAVKKGNPKNITTLADLATSGIRVAIARPETTLTGKYALEIFQKAGLAEPIEKNIISQAARPDHLVSMLILDQVDAGIVWHFYPTLAPDKIEIVYLPPQQITGVGKMQIALSVFGKDSRSAQKLLDFATSAEGKPIFQKHGYMVAAEEVKKYYPGI
jgi:molybdate transport system substrate-binding protein